MKNIRDIVRINVASGSRPWTSRSKPVARTRGLLGSIVSSVASCLRFIVFAMACLVDWIQGRFSVGSKKGLRTIGSGPLYDDVVVAGTFDRLHAGHRLLIFAAMMVLKDGGNLWLGVTGDSLTKSKRFRESLEPYSLREAAAARFARTLVKSSKGITVHTGEITNPRRGIDGQVTTAEALDFVPLCLHHAYRRSIIENIRRVRHVLGTPKPQRTARDRCPRRVGGDIGGEDRGFYPPAQATRQSLRVFEPIRTGTTPSSLNECARHHARVHLIPGGSIHADGFLCSCVTAHDAMRPSLQEGHKEMSIVIVGVIANGDRKLSSTQLRQAEFGQ